MQCNSINFLRLSDYFYSYLFIKFEILTALFACLGRNKPKESCLFFFLTEPIATLSRINFALLNIVKNFKF